jgi:hypothetical protein
VDDIDAILAKAGVGAEPSRAPLTAADRAAMTHGGPAPAQGSAVSLQQLDAAEAANRANAAPPSTAAAVLRGAGQGLTMGFGDELGGAIGSMFSRKTYEQIRDEIRAADKAAQEAHPFAFGAGEIGGGIGSALIPGLGIARGAKLATTVGKAALSGGIYGAGKSEGETAGDIIADAAKGAAVGGAAGAAGHAIAKGVGAVARGAQGRVDKRLLSDIGDKALPNTRAKLAERAEDVVSAARRHGLEDVARKPVQLAEAATAARKDVGQQLGPIWKEADAAVGGVKASRVVKALRAVQKRYADANPEAAEAIQKRIDQVTAIGKRVPSDRLNKIKGGMQESAFASPNLSPRVGVKAAQEAAGAVKKVLADHVDDAIAKGAPIETGQLQRLNADYGALSLVLQAAKKRAQLAEFPTTGLRDIAGGGLRAAGIVASAATASPLPYIAERIATKGVPAAARGIDRALAALVRKAQMGATEAQLLEQAAKAGVERGLARQIYGRFGGRSPEMAEAVADAS